MLKGVDRILKSFWDEFVYGGHFLALGDALTMYVIGNIVGVPVSLDFILIVYLCVFGSNLYNRSDEAGHDKITNPIRVKIMQKYVNNFKLISSLIVILVLGLIIFYSNVWVLIFACFVYIISLLYTTIFKKITKYIIGFKSIIAAVFYSLMVFLMALYYRHPINAGVVLIFAFYFVRIFISNAACDLKDVKSDKARGLKTLAVVFGDKGSAIILNTINILSGLIIIYGIWLGVFPLFSMAILLTIPYASYYLMFYSRNNKEFLANAVVDGEFLLWIVYLWIGKAIF